MSNRGKGKRHLGHDLTDEVRKLDTGTSPVGSLAWAARSPALTSDDALEAAAERAAQASEARKASQQTASPERSEPPLPAPAERARARSLLGNRATGQHDEFSRPSTILVLVALFALIALYLFSVSGF